jgi:hypothetical protein
MPLFLDSRKRLERAVTHAEAFDSIWKSLINPKSYETSIEVNADWTEGTARFVHAPIPENNLALELGEMFYQLRASLDALVYKASVIAEKIDPPADQNRVEFPICAEPDRFKKSTINNSPFPQKIRDWIESIQPYNAAKTTNPELLAISTMLVLLHDCARKDRHRKLHIVAAVPTSVECGFDTYPGRVVSCHVVEGNLFEGKDEFLRFTLEGFKGAPGNIKLNSEVMVEVTIDEIPPLQSGHTRQIFNAIFQAVHVVIEQFEDWHK